MHPAIKVVSLSPSLTEYIFELDRGHLLIGRSAECRHPEAALEIEVVGDLDTAKDERLTALKPDVILVNKSMKENKVNHLESQGFTVVVFDHQKWDSVLRDLEILGKLLDAEGDVKTLISWLTQKRTTVENEINALEDHQPLSTAVLFSLNPLTLAAANTFIDELITLSGGSNITTDSSSRTPTLSPEALLQKQPEVILISAEAANADDIKELTRDPIWSQLSAFKNNRVYLIDEDGLKTPGPRQVFTLEEIAAALHPTIFPPPLQLKQINTRPEPQRP